LTPCHFSVHVNLEYGVLGCQVVAFDTLPLPLSMHVYFYNEVLGMLARETM